MQTFLAVVLFCLIGAVATTVFIGVRRMIRGDIPGSQEMMRWRVKLQALAIAFLLVAFAYTKFGGAS